MIDRFAPLTRPVTRSALRLGWRLALACLLAPSSAAFATGLGAALGEPIIGERLSLDIEVITPNRPALECFEFRPIEGGEDRYFPRRARLTAIKTEAGKVWLKLHGEEVREPIVEFRLTALCGAQVSRDYTLLASPGRELRLETPVAAQWSGPQAKAAPAETAKPVALAPLTASTATGPTLEQLARQRYPLQPKARAKFKRLMRAANADQLAAVGDDEALPFAADQLHYPENLPKRRLGPYVPAAKKKPITASASQAAASAETTPPPPSVPAQAEAPAHRDKLVISSGSTTDKGASSPAEAAVAEKVEASFAAQADLVAKLAQAENAYQELKDQLLAIESRMAALEQEKQRLKREAEKQTDGSVVEFVIAILLGGVLGALLMTALRRRGALDLPPKL